jgi:hypothetical protein
MDMLLAVIMMPFIAFGIWVLLQPRF